MSEAQQPEKLVTKSAKLETRSSHQDAITVERLSGTTNQRLSISFRRTIRVADNDETNDLPPDLGPFPVYNTKAYKGTLPRDMSGKPGFFIPMYQREAMWINFESTHAFAIKVYVGGVNAVSGEPARETEITMMRRLKLLQERKNMQDYVVAPKQLWLDGIANADGNVRQFVAMLLGKGYTVEAQISGEEVIGGIQFEVTPCKIPPGTKSMSKKRFPKPKGTKYFQITVRDLAGDETTLEVASLNTIQEIKDLVEDAVGNKSCDQRLIYGGKQLQDDRTLADHGIDGPCMMHLVMRMRGGGGGDVPANMGLGAGGLIRQTIIRDRYNPAIWEPNCGTIFNVQILNSARFRAIAGVKPPPTAVTAQAYAEYGFPYFKIFDEKPSGVEGNFEGVKSIRAMDAEGKPTEEKAEAVAEVAKSTNNAVVLLDDKGNKVGFRTVSQMEKAVRDRFGELTI